MKNSIAGLSMSFSHMNFKNIDLLSFNSYNSLLDYDIVIIDLGGISLEYTSEKNYAGKRLLTEHNSFEFVADFKRRKEEIKDLLALGKTLYVMLPSEASFYIYTGKNEYSGTGRNRQTTNIVHELNILNILPIKLNVTTGLGSKLAYSTDSPYKSLFEIKDMEYYYNAYFSSEDNGIPVAYIANTEKNISKVFPINAGRLIVFPSIFDEGDYSSEKEYRKVINNFLHTIDDLEEEIKVSLDDYSLPEWADKYNILTEKNEKEKIEELNKEIEKLEIEKEKTKGRLSSIQKYKLAFTASGKELETIIYEIFSELGFKSMPIEHNRADGIFEYDDLKIVTEIKGVNGSSAEKHGAQLEKWVSEFVEKEGTIPKAILIVNGFRKKDLSARNEAVFPNQMIDYSTKREHCLISTVQLLGIFIDVKNNPSKKEEIITKLLNTVGVYSEYMDFKKFL
ncbi:hypothetical protein JZO66_10595 [Enterococcus sp. DIV0242_7C1]|uniref:Uncharacterized protein n=1 Tax=Candidatus Enterococcus dunnyi TaxID=1834192 RepID=A0A200JA20_9ENTE|nr:hypothetical protein [Enterococcus sp. 9D6_DIV0238]MBO0470993.1 hypothetical protein [Enterococcus sp. DIV0242_7C1]OUZ33447.1 hypothetical protein A5889_002160 [Enterococcus sp. 9D6_DIV0238]